MKIASTLFVTAFVTMPCVAGAETFQLWLELFDESRDTTICKYRSGLGNDEVTEYSGRYLCPRVACVIPPTEGTPVVDTECVPGEALPLS